jgi:hypothetical protein
MSVSDYLQKSRDATLTFLRDRKTAYKLLFKTMANPASRIVLEDLARFCRANESCIIPGDHDRSMLLEGRREVWLRIQQHLNLTTEELFALYTAKGANNG